MVIRDVATLPFFSPNRYLPVETSGFFSPFSVLFFFFTIYIIIIIIMGRDRPVETREKGERLKALVVDDVESEREN